MVCFGAADNVVRFENKKAAFEFNCSGEGDVVSRVVVNGSYNYNSPETGVSCTPVNPETGFSYFHVSILLGLASNNNTNISCEVVNATNAIVEQKIFRIQIQGLLEAPPNFSVVKSNSSNTTFTLFWGAPFSLPNTEGLPDISNYILCTNITIFGCRTILSEPDCTFPRNCNSSINFGVPGPNGEHSLAGTAGYGGPIEFSFSAVNGAGSGRNATFVLANREESSSTIRAEHANLIVLAVAFVLCKILT
ncbi:hypothetical protein EMCRGX_G009727 [Ephydatia muelleri]